MSELKVSAILLAAGLSRRMGGRDKLLLLYRGKTLLQLAVGLLDSMPVFEKILVTTAERMEKVAIPATVRGVINPNPEEGQSGSIRLGLELATGEWYLFMAADQPGLTTDCLLRILDIARENPDKIVYPSISGMPTMPCLFPARFKEALMRLSGDTGGRAVREAYPGDCLTFEAENPESYLDIDSEEDWIKSKEI